MTAENNGTGAAPEGDDPFAHLYRQEGGDGSTAPQHQPGVPRRSYNQVRTVGERQYGQRPQPNAYYQAPETMPGGRAATRQGPPPPPNGGGHGGGRGGRGGRNHNGLLIGAIAVVAAVVVGIGAAVVFNSDTGAQADNKPGASSGTSEQKKQSQDTGQKTAAGLPKEDASKLLLDGGASTMKEVPGAKAAGGTYVGNFNKPGAKVTWDVKAPHAGDYRLYVQYSSAGEDANATLSVNGTPNPQPLGMKNFTGAPKGDWEKGWMNTWAPVTLTGGDNKLEISCGDGNQCNAIIDQVWLGKA